MLAFIGSVKLLPIGSIGRIAKHEGGPYTPIIGTCMAKVLREATKEEWIQYCREELNEPYPELDIPKDREVWFYQVSMD